MKTIKELYEIGINLMNSACDHTKYKLVDNTLYSVHMCNEYVLVARNINSLHEAEKIHYDYKNEIDEETGELVPSYITVKTPWENINSDVEFTTTNTSNFYKCEKDIVKCKIQIKSVNFSFTLNKIDFSDLERMQFVYDILIACDGEKTLYGLSNKNKPKFDTIAKKYPKILSRSEWENFNIHDKNEIISIIKKLCK